MESSIYKRLLLAKEFHLNACKLAKKTDQLSRMMSVHNFHIGIEILLKAILLKHEIRTENALDISFDGLMADVDKHPKFKENDKKLPYRQQINGLNRMRGLVQHHAKVPDPSDLDDYRLYAERFLVAVFRDYFDVDFVSINRISFIEDEFLKMLLKRASDELKNEERVASICFSSAAFEYARDSISKVMRDMYTLSRIGSSISRSPGNTRGELTQAFKHTLEKVTESERLTILLTSGILLSDFRKFKKLTPNTRFMSAGNPHFQVGPNYSPDAEDASWVRGFVIGSIINWQQIGLNPVLEEHYKRGVDHFLANGI